MDSVQTIYTIGHSTHDFSEFVKMLHAFKINVLADIRHFPGSRKFPHFNKDFLTVQLPSNNIKYCHIEKLGGRRKARKDSKIRHGGIRHFAVMLTIWKLTISLKGLMN